MKQVDMKWLVGTVIRGDGRGHELGFPTANLELDAASDRPADGIYAAWVKIDPSPPVYKAVMHVGPRPTIPGASASVEVHLLESPADDLHGKQLLVAPAQFLREIKKFDSLSELSAAIAEDVQQSMNFFATATPPSI